MKMSIRSYIHKNKNKNVSIHAVHSSTHSKRQKTANPSFWMKRYQWCECTKLNNIKYYTRERSKTCKMQRADILSMMLFLRRPLMSIDPITFITACKNQEDSCDQVLTIILMLICDNTYLCLAFFFRNPNHQAPRIHNPNHTLKLHFLSQW
jgi:hypothetical protein